jgi:hypothetical protein
MPISAGTGGRVTDDVEIEVLVYGPADRSVTHRRGTRCWQPRRGCGHDQRRLCLLCSRASRA